MPARAPRSHRRHARPVFYHSPLCSLCRTFTSNSCLTPIIALLNCCCALARSLLAIPVVVTIFAIAMHAPRILLTQPVLLMLLRSGAETTWPRAHDE
ncbi:hypothetical protein PENSPDRAFT_221432 [Peniophora sp. CONT]|nr:hypothetical protein PENSPDRAFT_221432 [Peniophora sp. CONT]